MIACPSCGRDNVGVWNLAEAVEERLRAYPQAFEVAVMGCAVNGPGEAGDADFGVAGGRETGFIYAHGRVLRKVESELLVDELFREIDTWIEGGMIRPEAPEAGQAGGPDDGRGRRAPDIACLSEQPTSASAPRSLGARAHLALTKASSLGFGRVRTLAWCSRRRDST